MILKLQERRWRSLNHGSDLVRERRNYKQQSESSSSRPGEPPPTEAERTQPDLTSALAGTTTLSRPVSGVSAADGDAGSAARNQSAIPDFRRAFTVNDTARMLSISRSTLYKLIKSHSLTSIKLCGRRLVTRDSIEDLLAGGQSVTSRTTLP